MIHREAQVQVIGVHRLRIRRSSALAVGGDTDCRFAAKGESTLATSVLLTPGQRRRTC